MRGDLRKNYKSTKTSSVFNLHGESTDQIGNMLPDENSISQTLFL